VNGECVNGKTTRHLFLKWVRELKMKKRRRKISRRRTTATKFNLIRTGLPVPISNNPFR
jgi:hypothetical protein